MYYRMIHPGVAVRTIAPEQYDRLRQVGFKVHGNGTVKTVYVEGKQYEQERPQAIAYCHEQHHLKHDTCYYEGCERSKR